MNVAIILAAGEGKRMKSNTPKVLHNICGQPILNYVLKACKMADIQKSVVIVGHGKDKVMDYFKDKDVIFREQPTGESAPYGTGFAVMQAIDEIPDDGIVTVLCGDTPLITDTTLYNLMNFHKKGNYDCTVLTAILENSYGYGRIVRKQNSELLKIVEQKDAVEEELDIKEINSGVYCFNGKALKYALSNLDNNNAQNEYYLTDAVSILNNDNYRVGAYIIDNSIEIQGVNNRVQLASCEAEMRNRINEKMMLDGVTIIDPNSTYIEPDVIVGQDTIIYPGVVLEGNTTIGESCIIRSNTRICNSKINSNVDIESSLIESSVVEEGCHIGPYAHLRPKSHLGKNVKIGNFVEVKNSIIGDNSKAGHLAYIGDADVGMDVNIGCAVVFVNYNGHEKFRTIVENNAFIGSNSNLVAPVRVEEWGYVAAGSTITENVGKGDLSIARARQVNKAGWADKKGYKKHK